MVIPLLVVPHILIAAFVIGINLIGAFSELTGTITKKAHYDRFARASARFTLLLFAVGSALAFTFLLSLITLYPIFFSQLMNIFFWVFLAEAFMFVGEVIMVYAWYHSWDRMAYRKNLHVVFGLVGGLFGLTQMIFIDVVASYMLTPSNAQASDVGWTFFNPTYITLNLHRFVGNFSYAGFLIAGWAGFRYLRTTREDDREYYDWMGHFGLLWGFGFLIMQPIIGYGYLKGIRESSPDSFNTIMLGDKSWVFNLLVIWIAVMSIASTAYFVHKLRFAVKPIETLRKLSVGALGFTALFTVLNIIPANANLIPQIGLVFGQGEGTQIPLGSMYPWKYIGLIGMMLVGFFILALYLRASATGFHWGRASRWSQFALMACSVAVVLTMVTMGYTRETARRVDNNPGYLIHWCVKLDQQIVSEKCPTKPITERKGG